MHRKPDLVADALSHVKMRLVAEEAVGGTEKLQAFNLVVDVQMALQAGFGCLFVSLDGGVGTDSSATRP